MSGLVPYLHFAGNAREALTFYRTVFGGELTVHTLADFGRDDGSAHAIAHGMLVGPVTVFAADASAGEPSVQLSGVEFSLLGAAPVAQLTAWFAALAEEGTVLDPLQLRPWGDHDGTVRDRFGITWLIGYQG